MSWNGTSKLSLESQKWGWGVGLLLYEAIGQFIDTMAHYDFERLISMEFTNEEDEDFEFDINVFDEDILANIREALRLKIGQYGGEDE